MKDKKLPISHRLSRCAEFVPQGARVADIGCDHGYLSIELLRSSRASFVHACDLRQQPLRRAMENALRFGVHERMRFSQADGLKALDPAWIDTIVCAGMGGDLIAGIIEDCPWVKNEAYRLILQPQSSGNYLRRRLTELGFAIEREALAEDGGFLYYIICARFGASQTLSPGQEYCSPQLLKSGDPLLPAYLARIEKALTITVEGLRRSSDPEGRKLSYFETALREIQAMKEEIQCQA